MMNQKELLVMNRLLVIIVICLITACSNKKQKNTEEINLLNVYFDESRKDSIKDSVFLGLENTNGEIFKTYKRYVKNSRVQNDSLLNKIFSIDEFKNFEMQTTQGTWDIDLSKFDNVVYESKEKINKKILYVTKPIFTADTKYALIYSYNKRNDEIYFIPSIQVYEKVNYKWKKVSTIKHF